MFRSQKGKSISNGFKAMDGALKSEVGGKPEAPPPKIGVASAPRGMRFGLNSPKKRFEHYSFN